jgi:hypothetical protein
MPNISFDSIMAKAGANARAFVQQLGKQTTVQGGGSATTGSAASFGEMLLQRQQTLSLGSVAPQVVLPEGLPFNLSAPAATQSEPTGIELNPILVSETKLQTPSRSGESKPADVAAITAGVVGPDGTTSNAFGHWEMKPAALRPFFWKPEGELDGQERGILEKWKASPYNLIWKYEVEPGKDNNWAGWGPPPPGWTTRSEIPRGADGSFLGNGLPWPPPGEPPVSGGPARG